MPFMRTRIRSEDVSICKCQEIPSPPELIFKEEEEEENQSLMKIGNVIRI